MNHGEGEAKNRSPVSGFHWRTIFHVFGGWRRRIGMGCHIGVPLESALAPVSGGPRPGAPSFNFHLLSK
jgi:hypothetical protein